MKPYAKPGQRLGNPRVHLFLITVDASGADGLQRENSEYGDMLIAPSIFEFVDDGNFINFGNELNNRYEGNNVEDDDFWYHMLRLTTFIWKLQAW